jgi:polyvinyl alcohol dehydrogenase (cytochrome)
MPGVVFSGAMDGYLRAYDMKTGKIVWSFNAARNFPSVDGVPTHGGAFSATGATIVDGMVYVSSGYSGIPGNALLAFGVGQ